MKVLLHKIYSVTLLLVLFISTSGISFYLHTCGCSHNSDINFINKTTSCCILIGDESEEDSENISKSSCCIELFFFYKLPVPFIQNITTSVYSFVEFIYFDSEINSKTALIHSAKIISGNKIESPPLIFGRQLIQFLHSIKIPFPVL